MPLETDFDVSPFFDDYDSKKNYYRILYRPSVALQARELTQMQSMEAFQRESFAGNIYKDGSRIEGCTPTILPNLDFVRVVDNFIDDPVKSVLSITQDYLLVGQTSRVRAQCIIPVEGLLVNDDGRTNRFYIKYISSEPQRSATFVADETILIYNENQDSKGPLNPRNLKFKIKVISSVAGSKVLPIGKGYGFRIEDGMVFQKGYFQNVAAQTIIVRDFDQDVGGSLLGFNTIEEIITDSDDFTLNDNALGYPNENAPGAYRLRLNPVLVVKTEEELKNNQSQFFTLFSFSKVTGEVIQDKRNNPYDEFGSYLNNRTFEESGNYVVKPFLASPTTDTANSLNFAWQLTAGKGYVNGSRVEWLSPDSVSTKRPFETKSFKNQIVTANFGNYLFVNEFSGSLDIASTSGNIDIYDVPQKFVSKYNTSPIGNKVGTAKLKFYVYESGIPGAPETQYKMYITEVIMNPGYSFSRSAKSFVATSSAGVIFAADVILNNNGSAVLYQNEKRALIATFGKIGLKTLSPDGTWDTNFDFVGQSVSELQRNGQVFVTTNSSAPGGDDILAYGVGRLNDAVERQIIISLNENVQSNILNGPTVRIYTQTVETVTTKYAELAFGDLSKYVCVGEYIRDPVTSTQERVIRLFEKDPISRKIVAEISNTGNLAPTGDNYIQFCKYWPAGYKIPLVDGLSGQERYVEILSSTSLTAYTGLTDLNIGTTNPKVTIRYNMRRINAQPTRKVVKKDVLVKLNLSSHPNGYNGPWPLGFSDVFKVKAVYGNKETFDTTNDISNLFTFDTGQTDTSYETSQLVLKERVSLADYLYIVVKLDFFEPNQDFGTGFFSVDSYPTSYEINNIPDDKIAWSQIPVYSAGNGNKYDLRDSLDYRSVKTNTATIATEIDKATVNPSKSTSFIPNTLKYLIIPDSNVDTDFEIFLPRKDYIGINSQGKMIVINGKPSESPVEPIYDVDFMPVAIGYVPPYPSLTPEEFNVYRRSDYLIKSKAVFNRGYTMRDIGVLDQRIQNLEYYNVLNALEQQAQALKVKDIKNNDRFKNGIFVDPMNSHAFGDFYNTEYKWSIDVNKAYGRPSYSTASVDLEYVAAESTNIQQTGSCITLPYSNELIISQPYATKVRNNTQDFWAYNGDLDLFPNYDMNQDVTINPVQDVIIDQYQPTLDLVNVIEEQSAIANNPVEIIGTQYGRWNVVNQTRTQRGNVVTVRTTEERSGQEVIATPLRQTQSLDPYVTDVAFQPFIKSRTVAFNAYGMKPNTRVYAFFDNKPVSEFCAQGTLNTAYGSDLETIYKAAYAAGKPESIVVRNSPLGSPMITDSNGEIYGVFVIPAGGFKFGDRVFMLMDQDSVTVGSDAAITKASGTFTASNISVTKRGVDITTITPQFERRCKTERRTSTYTYVDPLGQSFRIEAPELQSGVMITKMDLFFKQKSSTLGVSVRICGMINGQPDGTNILSSAYVDAADVTISQDATAATTFVFDEPVFLNSNMDYAFYVYPDANNPDYSMWVSEIGAYDITNGSQVSTNPYIGDLFRSSNSKTWVALPREDIKFNIYVANFQMVNGVAVFNNENDEYVEYEEFILKNDAKPIQVNDEVRLLSSVNPVAIPLNTQKGFVQFIDISKNQLTINDSTGLLKEGSYIGIYRTSSTGANNPTPDQLIATMKIKKLVNPPIHSICPRFGTAIPTGTNLEVSFQGTDAARVRDSEWIDLDFDTGLELIDKERFTFSRSNAEKTLSLRCLFQTNNKYISPVINFARRNALCIENLVNDKENLKFEYKRNGTAISKYISQKVTLADGQDAEDIRVYVTGYRPAETDIAVYVKFLAGEDPDLFENKNWTKLVNDSEGLFCSTIDTEDFKEFVFSVPTSRPAKTDELPGIEYSAFLNADNRNFITYYAPPISGAASEPDRVYTTYKVFAIKIVLTSSNGIWCPKVDDVRAIALQI